MTDGERAYYKDVDVHYSLQHFSPGKTRTCFLSPKTGATRRRVFFVHGLGNDLFFPHRLLFSGLLKEGFSVYTFDLAGHGQGSETVLTASALKGLLREAFTHALSLGEGPVFLAGYSLGGLSAISFLGDELWGQIQKASLIGVPGYAPFRQIAYGTEGFAICHPDFWRHLEIYGLYEGLPGMGGIRRKAFPIRFPQGAGAFWDHLETLWQAFSEAKKQGDFPKRQDPIQLIYGSRDRIALLGESDFFYNNTGLAIDLVRLFGETHFSLILSRQTQDELNKWFRV
jgi:pimeloyl-ACP methyl ester carboxylesterase